MILGCERSAARPRAAAAPKGSHTRWNLCTGTASSPQRPEDVPRSVSPPALPDSFNHTPGLRILARSGVNAAVLLGLYIARTRIYASACNPP